MLVNIKMCVYLTELQNYNTMWNDCMLTCHHFHQEFEWTCITQQTTNTHTLFKLYSEQQWVKQGWKHSATPLSSGRCLKGSSLNVTFTLCRVTLHMYRCGSISRRFRKRWEGRGMLALSKLRSGVALLKWSRVEISGHCVHHIWANERKERNVPLLRSSNHP